VLKLGGARQRVRTKHGRCEGRKPFGSKPGKQATIARMKALQRHGLNVLRITQQLNTEGLKPRAAEQWHPFSVARILQVGLNHPAPIARLFGRHLHRKPD
jgi:hypothetical protein